MGKTTLTLMIITILSKISGLIRDMTFSYAYGTDIIKDIYIISESVATIAFSFLFMSIQSTFIPVYSKIKSEHGRKAADRFTSNLTNILLIIAIVVLVLAIIFMRPILSIVAKGFQGEALEQAITFTRINIFSILFMAINACMISYLNIYNNFTIPATTGIFMNIILISSAFLSLKFKNPMILAYGAVLSSSAKYFLFPSALRKTGYRHKLIVKPKDPHLIDSLQIAIPMMFSIIVNDFSIIIDKTIATTVVREGGVSSLDYAYKILQLIDGIVIVSIITVVYPKMSQLVQAGKIKSYKKLTNSSMVSCLLLVIPATVGLMLFVDPIVSIIYERGAFSETSHMLTTGALFWYAPCLIASVFLNFLNRSFYSLGDTKTPLIIAGVQVLFDIVLNIVLSKLMGLNGLAFSTTIGNFIASFLLIYLLKKKVGRFHLRQMSQSILKISIATLIMALLSYSLYRYLPITSMIARFLLALIIAILSYFICILFMQIPEVKRVINQIYHKYKRRRA